MKHNSAEAPTPGVQWWQILLSVTVLPLGLAAPLGATVLGWLAMGDIRRSQGRISGLPLAVFDGLLFPLLALDVLIYLSWVNGIYELRRGTMADPYSNPPQTLIALGGLAICALVDFLIIRRVWRAVRPGGVVPGPGCEWWWSSKRGGIVLALLCVVVIGVVATRRSKSDQAGKAHQIAQRDPLTGRLVARLPGRGTVELLAIGEPYAPLNGWWSPDGTPLSNTLYEVGGAMENKSSRRVSKDLLFRAIDLPDGASSGRLEAEPDSGAGSGGDVYLNGRQVRGGYQARMAWEPEVRTASVFLGHGLEPWRTIATQSTTWQSHQQVRHLDDPPWIVNFHHAPGDTSEGAQVSLIFGPENRMWEHRMVAVDTNGVEHSASGSNGTPIEKLTLWTHLFRGLPLREVKEFRLQVRPVYWVEFPDVALAPNAGLPEPRRPRFGPVREVTFNEIIDFDAGVVTNFPPDRGGPNPFQNYSNLVWMRQSGFDAGAGIGELWPVDMDLAVLESWDWNDLRESELVDRIYHGHYHPTQLKPLAEGRLPLTYGFRTRECSVGILQIVAFANGKPGATVRYKLRELGVARDRESQAQ